MVDMARMSDGSWRELDLSAYDVVYHVAGIAHVDRGKISKEREKLYYAVNTDLTIEVAEKAKASGVKQFIYMSSLIVYGNSSPAGKMKLITRDTPESPASCYGDSKVKAEKGILTLCDDTFHVAVIRSPMIYGSGCKGNYPLLSKMAQSCPVFPYVQNTRSMIYIENLGEFVRLLIDNEESGIFWPQNAQYSNTGELVRLIGAAHGKRVILVKGFGWLLRLASMKSSLIRSAFGSLCVDREISEYKADYQIFSLEKSIERTEMIYENSLDR